MILVPTKLTFFKSFHPSGEIKLVLIKGSYEKDEEVNWYDIDNATSIEQEVAHTMLKEKVVKMFNPETVDATSYKRNFSIELQNNTQLDGDFFRDAAEAISVEAFLRIPFSSQEAKLIWKTLNEVQALKCA